MERKRKDRKINRESNQMIKAKIDVECTRKERIKVENRLNKVEKRKIKVMKQNRMLKRNVLEMKERIITRNEKIKIISEENKELNLLVASLILRS